jgi:hypothetical protein
MTVTIPRAEIHAIGQRYGTDYDLESDPTVEWVRQMARWLRRNLTGADEVEQKLMAEAHDLDALADRVENERDEHCVAYSEDPATGRCECGHDDDVHDRQLGQCEAPLQAEVAR